MLQADIPPSDAGAAVRRVLLAILVANLAVVAIKLGVGSAIRSLAVIGDGLHSSVDAVNNLFGLAVVRVATQAPDRDHPYGHGKFETLGALGIVIFLSVSLFELLRGAVDRLTGTSAPVAVGWTAIGLLGLTLLINLVIVRVESAAGRRLESEFLLADAAHTRVDVFITLAVLAGLGLSALGLAWADALVAIIVAGFVGRIGVEILQRALPSLVDEVALPADTIAAAARTVPGVHAVYGVRSRRAAATTFAELTIAVPGDQSVSQAHRVADAVEATLRRDLALDQLVVHVEPC